MAEKTLVLIKPDGVKRNIIGKILSRFEDTGLKVVAMKMIHIDEEHAGKHYPLDEQWAKQVFDKTKAVYEKENKPMRYGNYLELASDVRNRNINFIKEGPVVAIVFEGPHAVEIVRKLIGSTEPRQAMPGTIRGDFISVESYVVADADGRAARNLVHASDSVENANREIALWFRNEEITRQ